MTIGQRIRSIREEKNLGLTELASKVQISKQTLYKYENDIITNIPSNKIEEIAKVLETTPGYLMGWEEFVDDVQQGHVDLDELSHALEMYRLYKQTDNRTQSMIDFLLDGEEEENQ